MATGETPADNLVQNPGFEQAGEDGAPEGWEVWAPRDEIRPEVSVDPAAGREGAAAAISAARHRDAGQLQQTVGGIEGGETYGVRVWLRTERVASPHESVWVKLLWLGADEKLLEKQLVPPVDRDGDWLRAAARLEAPAEAVIPSPSAMAVLAMVTRDAQPMSAPPSSYDDGA